MRSRSPCIDAVAVLSTVCLMALIGGCGGGGGQPAPPNADVPVRATITAFSLGSITPADSASVPAANEIESVVVETADRADTFAIPNPAATFDPAGPGGAQQINLRLNAAKNRVTLDQTVTCVSSAAQFNTITITSPVTVRDSQTGTETTLNRLIFQFECLPNGTVVSPDTLTVSIPSSGKAANKQVVASGLSGAAPDYARVEILDNQGGLISKTAMTAANNKATLTDVGQNLTAALLTGGRVALSFARSDANVNPIPDLLETPTF